MGLMGKHPFIVELRYAF
jgi:serine/threonine protein kinase